MVYDEASFSFTIFGGWANRWFSDLWTIDAGRYVGPPYNITKIEPSKGEICGGSTLRLSGTGFKNSRSLKVKFQGGVQYGEATSIARFVSENELTVEVPDLEQFLKLENRTMNVALSINDAIDTIHPITFRAYTSTCAKYSAAFGPGLTNTSPTGIPLEFVIMTRDKYKEVRMDGGDSFTVEIVRVIPPAEDDDVENYEDNENENEGNGDNDEEEEDGEDEKKVTYEPIDFTITDNENGCHTVRFSPAVEGKYEISVNFDGSLGGKAGAVFGSPYTVEFGPNDDTKDEKSGLMDGDLFLTTFRSNMKETASQLRLTENHLATQVEIGDIDALLRVKGTIERIGSSEQENALKFDSQALKIKYLEAHGVDTKTDAALLQKNTALWIKLQKEAPRKAEAIKPAEAATGGQLKVKLEEFSAGIAEYRFQFTRESDFYGFEIEADAAFQSIADFELNHKTKKRNLEQWQNLAKVFGLQDGIKKAVKDIRFIDSALAGMKVLWEIIRDSRTTFEDTSNMVWRDVDFDDLEDRGKKITFAVKRKVPKDVRNSDAFRGVQDLGRAYNATVPLIGGLMHPSMRQRHWDSIKKLFGVDFKDPLADDGILLNDLMALDMHLKANDVEDITDQALKEEKMEKQMAILEESWSVVRFFEELFRQDDDVYLLRMTDDDWEMLEADQLVVQGLVGNRFMMTFEKQILTWQADLGAVSEVVQLLGEVQRLWTYLEPLFVGSEEVKAELPEDAERFVGIDVDVRKTLKEMRKKSLVRIACRKEGLLSLLEDIETRLNLCRRSLMDFLDAKRRQFPRFYFMSEADLLDVLSNGSTPSKIVKHVTKVFLKVRSITLRPAANPAKERPWVPRWDSTVGAEKVTFDNEVQLNGKPEDYLQTLLDNMTPLWKSKFKICYERSFSQKRIEWLMDAQPDGSPTDPGQLTLLRSFMHYVRQVEQGLNTGRLKDYREQQLREISDLVNLTVTKLSKCERQRVMCMITMDAHGRDIVEKLLNHGIDRVSHFEWQSQLKPKPTEDGLSAAYHVLNGNFRTALSTLETMVASSSRR